jgi:hypothetical protein
MVAEQYLQKRNAAPVGGERVTEAKACAVAQPAVTAPAYPAGGAGNVIFGGGRQDLKFFQSFSRHKITLIFAPWRAGSPAGA